MPWGYKTLGQVAWTLALGVEALKKKVEIEDLNKPITSKEIQIVIRNLPANKSTLCFNSSTRPELGFHSSETSSLCEKMPPLHRLYFLGLQNHCRW